MALDFQSSKVEDTTVSNQIFAKKKSISLSPNLCSKVRVFWNILLKYENEFQ